MTTKQLLITIGLPFSGKTTLSKKYAEEGWTIIGRDELLKNIVESDEFRQRLTSEIEGKVPSREEVFKIKDRIAIDMLSQAVCEIVRTTPGERFFYDGTNLQRAVRSRILKLREDGIDVSGIYLKVPIQEITERSKEAKRALERKGEFNEGAIKNLEYMHSLLEEPTADEGFYELNILESDLSESKNELRRGLK